MTKMKNSSISSGREETMKIYRYKLQGPEDQIETVAVEANSVEHASAKLASLGYSLKFGGWLILSLDINRKAVRGD